MVRNDRCHRGSDAAATGGDARSSLVAGGVTALTLGVAFGLMALGVPSFWVAFPVGFGFVLPAALATSRARRADDPPSLSRTEESPTAVETLKRRYAEGELSDEEFERRVERLLEPDVGGADDGGPRRGGR
jgi:uncharacterized membrane protein